MMKREGSAAQAQQMTAPHMQGLQGDLQVVFDVLYEMGVIEPVLKMDWQAHLRGMESQVSATRLQLDDVIQQVNRCAGDASKIREKLASLAPTTLEVLAIEVAREYANFHSRDVVH
jgi:hypothetical protein